MLTPRNTYIALLIVQALHLLHHRLTKTSHQFRGGNLRLCSVHSLVGTAPGVAVYGNTRRVDFGASSWKHLDQKALA